MEVKRSKHDICVGWSKSEYRTHYKYFTRYCLMGQVATRFQKGVVSIIPRNTQGSSTDGVLLEIPIAAMNEIAAEVLARMDPLERVVMLQRAINKQEKNNVV